MKLAQDIDSSGAGRHATFFVRSCQNKSASPKFLSVSARVSVF
jgi:hypothetical protein